MPDMLQAGPLPSLTPVDGLAETSPRFTKISMPARIQTSWGTHGTWDNRVRQNACTRGFSQPSTVWCAGKHSHKHFSGGHGGGRIGLYEIFHSG
eukprot:2887884-Prymnesium_polylepis.1